jgi:hypothetical protein
LARITQSKSKFQRLACVQNLGLLETPYIWTNQKCVPFPAIIPLHRKWKWSGLDFAAVEDVCPTSTQKVTGLLPVFSMLARIVSYFF